MIRSYKTSSNCIFQKIVAQIKSFCDPFETEFAHFEWTYSHNSVIQYLKSVVNTA